MGQIKTFFIIAVMSAALFFFSDNKADPDLWGHLAFGRTIYETHEAPRVDAYSYTSAGSKWINHEWLSELVFYGVTRYAGPVGLLVLKTLIGLAIAFILYLSVTAKTRSVLLAMVFLFVSFSMMSFGFLIRPQIFTYFFFTLVIFLLEKFRGSERDVWIYPLPVIFLLWANMHGGFVAGLAVLFLFYAFRTAKGGFDPKFTAVCLLSFLVTFVNPYGPGLWGFLLRSLSRARPYLPEWGGMELGWDYTDYLSAVVITLAGLFFARKKRDPFEVALLCAAIVVSMAQKRHLVLFAAAFCIFVPGYVASILELPVERLERRISKGTLTVIFSCLALFFIYSTARFDKTDPLKIEVPADRYPVNALKFLKDNGINGNIFCFFDWSQMCIRQLPAGNKVFFDGRYRTVYSDELINGYFDVLYGERNYKSFLRKYPETDIMLLHPSNPLAALLPEDPAWVKIYSSPVSVIFIKKSGKNGAIVKRFENGQLTYAPSKGPFYLE